MVAAVQERLNAEMEEEQERLRSLKELFQGASMPDVLDNAMHMESVRFAGALADRSARRLSMLRRISFEGSNFERCCEDCGEPIPLSRLLAAPESVCCRNCQAIRDGERLPAGESED